MALRERLIYAIEIVGDKATTGISGIKSSIADADGAVGKFKAGTASAFSAIGANAAMMGVAAGGAIAAFAAKSVTAFTETAKAAIDLNTATGLNVEQSSRWIALADDYQVSADALATGLGKVAKTMDSTKWAKYGIETRDAAGKSREVNDILLDTFDMLSKVTNETDRARIGQELFGKGYQSLTPILGHTRAEYEKLLATQKDGQVITEEEAKKAEATRLALDELHDSIGEITLALGQALSPAVADMATQLADLVTNFLEAKNAVSGFVDAIPGGDIVAKGLGMVSIPGQLKNLNKGFSEASDGIKGLFGKGGDAPEAIEYTASKSAELIQSSIDLAAAEREADRQRDAARVVMNRYVDSLEDAHEASKDQIRTVEDLEEARREEAEAADRQRQASDDVAAALDRERSASLRLVGGDIAIRDAKRNAQAVYQEYLAAVEAGTIAKGDEQAEIDKVVSAYLREAEAIAQNKLTQMEANGETVNAAVQQQVMRDALDQTAGHLGGPFRQALLDQIAVLDDFERPRTARVTAIITTSTGLLVSPDNPFARVAGRSVIGASGAVVNRRIDGVTLGESGPEVVTPLDEMPGASPLPNGSSAGGETHIHIHAGTFVHESQLGQMLNRVLTSWQRNGGRPTFDAKG